MPIRVEDLLPGPRGRRFLLELAVRCDPAERLHVALYDTIGVSYPQPGTVLYALVPDDGVIPGDTFDEPPHRTEVWGPEQLLEHCSTENPTAAGFAEVLRTTALREPRADDIRLALSRAVDFARYWEGPDGEDSLAAHPAVQAELARFAARVLPHLPEWWSGPSTEDTPHVVVEFTDPDAPPSPPSDAAGIAVALGATLREEAANEGIWWSTPPWAVPVTSPVRHDADGATEIPRLLYMEDGSGWTRAHCRPVRVAHGERILTIDDPEDWVELCRRHPLAKAGTDEGTWVETTGRRGAWVMPDWAAVAQEVDGVHLTVRGYLSTAGRPLPLDPQTATLLAGFSPDQTIRFGPLAIDRDRSQTWRLAEDQETWELEPEDPALDEPGAAGRG